MEVTFCSLCDQSIPEKDADNWKNDEGEPLCKVCHYGVRRAETKTYRASQNREKSRKRNQIVGSGGAVLGIVACVLAFTQFGGSDDTAGSTPGKASTPAQLSPRRVETKNVFIPEYEKLVLEGDYIKGVPPTTTLDDYCRDGWEVKSSRRAWSDKTVLVYYVQIMAENGLDITKEESAYIKRELLKGWKEKVRKWSWGQEVVLQRKVPPK